jgi:general secretion pathway protein G
MNKKGFTLIELLIVVAIIGIIAAIAIPNLLIALQKGKQKATMGDMKSVGNAIESYITDLAFVPQVAAGDISSMNVSWFTPFYIKVLPTVDSWGTPFYYEGGTVGANDLDLYSIVSYGRNKADSSTTGLYDVTRLSDFNLDIYYSNGTFTVGPRVKR